MSENNIFSDLANATRLRALFEIRQSPARISALANSMNITIQALQRHVDRLLESGLILRDGDGNISLSPVGQALLEQIPSFEFMSRFKDYFASHSFYGIPKPFIQRIGELNNCRCIEDTIQGWQQAKIHTESCQEFLYGVTSVQPLEFYISAKELLKRGVRFRMVFSQNMIVAKGFEQKRQENGWIDAISSGQVEEKYVKDTPIMTGVSDIGAQLMFASTKTGQIDSNALFYSEDPEFRKWCMELFNYYWDEVEKIEPPELREI